MDKQKIGSCIAAVRREKGLTQKELGQRLHVSDRAVSKWERGLNLPDASLFEPLCRELELSLTELLRGERAAPSLPDMVQVVTDTVALADRQTRSRKRYRRLACLLACLLLLFAAPLAIQGWQDYQAQRHIDLDTSPVSVHLHYRDAALNVDASLLPGGHRMPRTQNGSVSESALYITRPREYVDSIRNVPAFDLTRQEAMYFSIPRTKSHMEITLYRWYEDRIGSGAALADGQQVSFSPYAFAELAGLPEENVYRFSAEPNYLYSIVVSWGDGYFEEHCFRTI